MGHPARHRLLATLLAASFALVATGCGENGVSSLPVAPAPSASPTPVDTGVEVDGVEPEDLEVSDVPGIAPGANLSFASPIYSVSAVEELPGPTTVRLRLDNALPRTSPVFVASRSAAGERWSYLPARLMVDQVHVEFTAPRLDDFGVLVMDEQGALQTFRDEVRSRLETGVDRTVEKPTCEETAEAKKSGYSVGFSRGKDAVHWCFGLEDERRVVRLVNRRMLPVQVTSGDAAVLPPEVTVPGAWRTWAAALTGEALVLPPGRTVTFDADLEPEQRLLVSVTTDPRVESLRALQATVGALVAASNSFGAGSGSTGRTVAALLTRKQCAKTLGQGSEAMLDGCFSRRKVRQLFGTRGMLLNQLTSARSTRAFLRKQFAAMSAEVTKAGPQNVVVRRAKPDFSALVGTFSGVGRTMTVSDTGVVFESVSNETEDGTTRVANVTYRLSEPEVDRGVATADAVVTRVKIFDREAFRGRVPAVGQTGRFRLDEGVVRSPFVLRTYCDAKAAKKGTCD